MHYKLRDKLTTLATEVENAVLEKVLVTAKSIAYGTDMRGRRYVDITDLINALSTADHLRDSKTKGSVDK